jgi:hypothetical protein
MDWCLIEFWKDSRIPLHVVLQGIKRSFETASSLHRIPPRTLYYCHPAVTEAFEQYKVAQVGSHEEIEHLDPSVFKKEQVEKFLKSLSLALVGEKGETLQLAKLKLADLETALCKESQPNYEELDRELSHIGGIVATALFEEQDHESQKRFREQIQNELSIYRKHLSKVSYQELFQSYLKRRLMEDRGLPVFSLFELNVSL